MNIIVFGAHPDDCELQVGGTAVKMGSSGASGKIRFSHERQRGASGSHENRACPDTESGSRRCRYHSGRCFGSSRQSGRRTHADPGGSFESHQAHTVMGCGHGHYSPPQRLPSRSPKHRVACSGHRLYGHCSENMPRCSSAEKKTPCTCIHRTISKVRSRSDRISLCRSTMSFPRKSALSMPCPRNSTSGFPGHQESSTGSRKRMTSAARISKKHIGTKCQTS